MEILYILWTILLLDSVWACSVAGNDLGITSSFVDLAAPRTLNLAFTYTWADINGPCEGLSFTDYQTIAFAGQSHYAEPVTITDNSLPETVTISFTDLTLTSLYTDGPDVTWILSWTGDITGGGTHLIALPSPSPPYTTSTSVVTTTSTEPTGPTNTGGGTTTTTTTSSHSSSISSGAIGGIVGGVLAGLIVIAAIGIFCCIRKPRARQPIAIGEVQQPYVTAGATQPYYQGGAQQGYQPEYKPPPPPPPPGAIPAATPIRYPEPDDFSGRTGGNY